MRAQGRVACSARHGGRMLERHQIVGSEQKRSVGVENRCIVHARLATRRGSSKVTRPTGLASAVCHEQARAVSFGLVKRQHQLIWSNTPQTDG